MENVSQIIKKHNKRVTKTNERSIAPCKRVTKTNKRSVAPCNCRDKNNCPMNGNCRVENIVYESIKVKGTYLHW